MTAKRFRNIAITVFVVLWLAVFHYESVRFFYLNPVFGRELPKTKLLFPPAGWIMFFQVDEQFGCAEVYGLKNGEPEPIDAHQIFRTRGVGYDNIRRNVLSTVISRQYQGSFCGFLKRKFPYFDGFLVTAVQYPSVIKTPDTVYRSIVYECRAE